MNSIKDDNTDLNELLIKCRPASYILRVSGESMRDGKINDGDLILVDSSIQAKHDDVVVAMLNGEFTIKKLQLEPRLALKPMNPDYEPIYLDTLGEGEDFIIFGVVTYSIQKT